MEIGLRNVALFICTLSVFSFHETHQYTYSCDSTSNCGCSTNPASLSRIVGGESAGSNTWDWVVSILIARSSLCGGTIISSSWIVSAAHCFQQASPSQVVVYAGSNTRFSGQSRVVVNIIMHPNFTAEKQENDIALIQFSPPFLMSNEPIKRICMPSVSFTELLKNEWPAARSYVVSIGWGRLTESGQTSSTLQQVTVQTIDYRSPMCSILTNRTVQLCAGVIGGGKDACLGDSGGPLMMFTSSQQWVLVGLTSYGSGCGRPNAAGVYTRVVFYEDWIKEVTNDTITYATSSDSANIDPYTYPNSSSGFYTIENVITFIYAGLLYLFIYFS